MKLAFTIIAVLLIAMCLLLCDFIEFIFNYLNLDEKDMINYFKEKRKLKKKKTS